MPRPPPGPKRWIHGMPATATPTLPDRRPGRSRYCAFQVLACRLTLASTISIAGIMDTRSKQKNSSQVNSETPNRRGSLIAIAVAILVIALVAATLMYRGDNVQPAQD